MTQEFLFEGMMGVHPLGRFQGFESQPGEWQHHTRYAGFDILDPSKVKSYRPKKRCIAASQDLVLGRAIREP